MGVVGVASGGFAVAEAGAVAILVLGKEGDEAVADVDGDFAEGAFVPGAGWVFDLEGIAVEIVVALESLDEDKVGGIPDRAAPV